MANGLNVILGKAKAAGLSCGLSASRNINIFYYLQLNRDKGDNHKEWILHTFEMCSRLKINYKKSQICFVGNVSMKALIVERILGCTWGEFQIKYLGSSEKVMFEGGPVQNDGANT